MEQTIKILYIGNDVETITALEQNENMQVHNETNGLKAFQWMTNHEFRVFDAQQSFTCCREIDAIVCEINLHGLNGLGLFQEMKKKGLDEGLFFILIAKLKSVPVI